MSGPVWRSSTRCESATCTEVAPLPDGRVGVRDGKLGDASPVLTFGAKAWSAFLAGLRAREFNRRTS